MASIVQKTNRQAEGVLKGTKRMKFDQIRQRHFWSSYFFTADASGYIPSNRYSLFTTPVGSNGQGFPSGQVITERESNWKSQNRVPDNQNFKITELGASVMPAGFAISGTAEDVLKPPSPGALSAFFQSTILNITYLTNSVPLGLLADFSQSSSPFFGVHNTVGTAVNYNSIAVNGFAAPALRRKFKIPIILGAGEAFNFTLEIARPVYIGYGLSTYTPFLIRVDFWATESFAEKS